MSPSISFAILMFLLGVFWSLTTHLRHRKPLPLGPPSLPIIGNLHMLGDLPHWTLHDWAKKYGPIMSLQLGLVPTIVVSSPKAAEIFLKTHNTVFVSRPKVQSSQYLAYGTKGIVFTEYGPYWRNVRKFCVQELLSVVKIDSFAGMRREEMGWLVEEMKEAAEKREVVDVSERVESLIEEMSYKMILGQSKDDMFDLKCVIKEVVILTGVFNIADYVPFLRALDL